MIGVTNMKMKLIAGRRDERQKAEELLRKRKATRFLAQVIAHTNRVVAAGRDFDEADEDDLVFILTGAVKFFAFWKARSWMVRRTRS